MFTKLYGVKEYLRNLKNNAILEVLNLCKVLYSIYKTFNKVKKRSKNFTFSIYNKKANQFFNLFCQKYILKSLYSIISYYK
jgi:hypothetical protein